MVGPGGKVRIRGDSKWNVPEPELTLAINAAGRIFGYSIGNDMSSRDIEGENPLYLPQAKTYAGSAALGPCLVVTDELPGEDMAHPDRDPAQVARRCSAAIPMSGRSSGRCRRWLNTCSATTSFRMARG